MRYAISDIHGCLKSFNSLLEKINFTKKDTLFILGDMIDRGSDSAGVIQRILDLKAEEFKIQCIMGNHEFMMLESSGIHNFTYSSSYEAQTLWFKNGGIAFLNSYEIERKDYNIFWECIPSSHREFLSSLPYHIELDDFILVHAGLKFKNDSSDRMMELMYKLSTIEITNPLEQTSDYDKVWIRNFVVDPEKMNGKTLVTGHTPLPLFDSIWPIRDESDDKKHIMIDGGCWYTSHKEQGFGNLVALCLDDKELFWNENCENGFSEKR